MISIIRKACIIIFFLVLVVTLSAACRVFLDNVRSAAKVIRFCLFKGIRAVTQCHVCIMNMA